MFEVNYTSNMSGVWDEVGIKLRDWDKKPISEIIEALRKGVATIDADRSAWLHREAPNGWGRIDTMMDGFLKPLLQACEENIEGTIEISR